MILFAEVFPDEEMVSALQRELCESHLAIATIPFTPPIFNAIDFACKKFRGCSSLSFRRLHLERSPSSPGRLIAPGLIQSVCSSFDLRLPPSS